MVEIIVIGFLILLFVGIGISEIRARKSNKKWLALKAKTLQRLADYKATDEYEKHAKWLVNRYCEVCDRIAEGGVFDAKQNMLYAKYSAKLVKELKRIGFFENPESEKEHT